MVLVLGTTSTLIIDKEETDVVEEGTITTVTINR